MDRIPEGAKRTYPSTPGETLASRPIKKAHLEAVLAENSPFDKVLLKNTVETTKNDNALSDILGVANVDGPAEHYESKSLADLHSAKDLLIPLIPVASLCQRLLDTFDKLSDAYHDYYEAHEDLEALHSSIEVHRYFISVQPHTDPMRSVGLFQLAALLRECFEKSQEPLSLLEDSLRAYEDALDLPHQVKFDRANALAEYASALEKLYTINKEAAMLDDALDPRGETISVGPKSSADLSNSIDFHALNVQTDRGPALGDMTKLNKIIALRREALSLVDENDTFHDKISSALANSMQEKWDQQGDISSLDDCIEMDTSVMSRLLPKDDDYLPSARNLILMLREKFYIAPSQGTLVQIIDLCQKVLAIAPEEDEDYHLMLRDLGESLLDYFRQGQDPNILNDAIFYLQSAVEKFSAHKLPVYWAKVTSALNKHYNSTSRKALLDADITKLEADIDNGDHQAVSRLDKMIKLARMLHFQYDQSGKEEYLQEAVARYEEVIKIGEGIETAKVLRSGCLTNLASLLRNCYGQSKNVQYLERALEYHRAALQLSLNTEDYLDMLINVGVTLKTLVEATGDAKSLSEALSVFQRADAICQTGNKRRGFLAHIYGDILLQAYKLTHDQKSLRDAITFHRESMDIHHSGHPNRLASLRSLIGSLQLAYAANMLADAEHLEEREALCEEALRGHEVGHAERSTVLHQLSVLHLDKLSDDNIVHTPALAFLLAAACDISKSATHFSHRLDQLQENLRAIEHAISSRRLQATRTVHSVLLSAYKVAIYLLPKVAYFTLAVPSRLQVLVRSEGLGADTALHAVAMDQTNSAVELLEEARAVFCTQALRLRALDHNTGESFLVQLSAIFLSLEHGSFGNSEQQKDAGALVTSLLADKDILLRQEDNETAEGLIACIRRLAGFDRFLMSPTYAALSQASATGPVVILFESVAVCMALVVPSPNSDAKAVKLTKLTPALLGSMAELVQQNDLNLRAAAGGNNAQEGSEVRGTRIRRAESNQALVLLSNLWNDVVRPIVDILKLKPKGGRERPRLHWCPTGRFTSLPLHAAGIYTTPTQYCSAFFVSSYAPTIGSLLKARHGIPNISKGAISALLIAQPFAPRFPNLDRAMDEVQVVANLARLHGPVTQLSPHTLERADLEPATTSCVKQYLADARILHMACHCQQDPHNALQSCFHLSDDALSLLDLMRLNLKNAVFTFLSACETAKGDYKLPDQVVHLAAAMLFIGFRSVIGTMWVMSDSTGPIVARMVYQELLKGGGLDLEAVPYALDAAVTQLRKQGYDPRYWAPFVHVGM